MFANSSFTAGKIKALRKVEVEWSPYGTTLESREISAEPTQAPHPINGKFKILFVGRHIERKGICYLIEAAKYLPRDKFEIRIVGVGDLTDKLKELAAQVDALAPAGLRHDEGVATQVDALAPSELRHDSPAEIVFTGKLSPEALTSEYKNANVFTLPAIVDSKGDTEGLGVVLIEAMELGLPIVASDVGGIPDVVVDGVSGILVPEKDPQALANAFKRLQSEPALVQKLLEGSRKRIRECFTWDGIIDRQIAAYKKIIRK